MYLQAFTCGVLRNCRKNVGMEDKRLRSTDLDNCVFLVNYIIRTHYLPSDSDRRSSNPTFIMHMYINVSLLVIKYHQIQCNT